MRIGLIQTKETPRATMILECFRQGAARHSDQCVRVADQNQLHLLDQIDVGVQVCFVNYQHGGQPHDLFRLAVFERMQELKKRLVVIDTGFVKNQYDYELRNLSTNQAGRKGLQDDKSGPVSRTGREVYYQVGFDGLKNHADYCVRKVGGDRWQSLGVKIQPWRKKGKHILVLGQALHGQSSQHLNILDWYSQALRELREHSKRPIVMRQHPRVTFLRSNRQRIERERKLIKEAVGAGADFSWSHNRLLEQDLYNCWAAVAFSTTAAITAVLCGVPVLVGSAASMAWDVSEHELSRIEEPALPERLPWARRLAYCQWNLAELASGKAWGHLRPHAQKEPAYRDPREG